MKMDHKVRALLRREGVRQQGLARELGVSQSTVHRWLKGAEPEGPHRDAINELFTETFGSGGGEATIPLKGYIGAGQVVESVELGGDEFVTAPPELEREGTVAAVVRGNSMLPVFRNGWTIYWSRLLPPDELLNELCVVKRTDGTILVKTLQRGSRPGVYTLASMNDDPIEDVTLEWAAPIDWIKTSR